MKEGYSLDTTLGEIAGACEVAGRRESESARAVEGSRKRSRRERTKERSRSRRRRRRSHSRRERSKTPRRRSKSPEVGRSERRSRSRPRRGEKQAKGQPAEKPMRTPSAGPKAGELETPKGIARWCVKCLNKDAELVRERRGFTTCKRCEEAFGPNCPCIVPLEGEGASDSDDDEEFERKFPNFAATEPPNRHVPRSNRKLWYDAKGDADVMKRLTNERWRRIDQQFCRDEAYLGTRRFDRAKMVLPRMAEPKVYDRVEGIHYVCDDLPEIGSEVRTPEGGDKKYHVLGHAQRTKKARVVDDANGKVTLHTLWSLPPKPAVSGGSKTGKKTSAGTKATKG
jgi:hypothetical protein